MKRRGNCYVAVEALYHLLGGKKSGWTPAYVKYKNDTHWFLCSFPFQVKGELFFSSILDPTRRQFKKGVPYYKGKCCGFLTRKPSKRARLLMNKILWQEVS